MTNFWKDLDLPIIALAPMEDVTDTVFRQIVRLVSGLESSDDIQQRVIAITNSQRQVLSQSKAGPSVVFGEFTSCEGVQSVAQAKVIHRLKFDSSERPIVAQVWGITPQNYYDTAKLILELGFDGIDINMGCPVKNVIRQGACSALIKNPSLAKAIITATHEGCGGKLPVSVKTRIGFNSITTQEWCGFLLSENKLAALTVHGRTVKEESKVPNHWDEIGKVVAINKSLQKQNQPNTDQKIAEVKEQWALELLNN